MIEIGPGGVVGRHPAAVSQLFVVVHGEGWVSSGDGEREDLVAGQAVLWEQGEEHASGSYEGMTAPRRRGRVARRLTARRQLVGANDGMNRRESYAHVVRQLIDQEREARV